MATDYKSDYIKLAHKRSQLTGQSQTSTRCTSRAPHSAVVPAEKSRTPSTLRSPKPIPAIRNQTNSVLADCINSVMSN